LCDKVVKAMRIYLDACCINRPFDDHRQDRVRLEAEAVLLILSHCEAGEWEWIGSEVLDYEIEQTPDQTRRRRALAAVSRVHGRIPVDNAVRERAKELHEHGFQPLDAFHLACAEKGDADVFLTTDDQILRVASRLGEELRIHVCNPLMWLNEEVE